MHSLPPNPAYVPICSLDVMTPRIEVGTDKLFYATGYRLFLQRESIYLGLEQLVNLLFHSYLMSGEITA